jgi:hypothetical protein
MIIKAIEFKFKCQLDTRLKLNSESSPIKIHI